MNTTALKSFAPAVRHQLMEAVARKLDHVLSAQKPDYLTTFAPQVDSLRNLTHADLLDGGVPSSAPQGEVYRHLVLAACRYYHTLLPNLFERLDDETELLLPDDLLTEHSIAHGFRTEITDADCAEVEGLGWVFQFLIGRA